MVGDMLRPHDLKNYNFDKVDPWGYILQEIAWAIRSIHHTTSKGSPGQLVISRYLFLNIPYIPNWENIRAHKLLLANKNTIKENKNVLVLIIMLMIMC